MAPASIVLVDPLAVDMRALRRLFASDALAVLHAAQQDLDVLTHAVGAVPRATVRHPGRGGSSATARRRWSSLLQGELGVTPAKGDRLTDWLRRPLTADQREYAAADVAYLLELHDRLDRPARRARPARLGRRRVRGAAHAGRRAAPIPTRPGCG